MTPAPGDRRGDRGRRGEAAAQALLERRGYTIVDANVRFGKTSGLVGELDIVAWDGPTLCFVEVKTRRARAGRRVFPVENVTLAKQRQIARLAFAYAVRHGLLGEEAGRTGGGVPLRFDVVAVTLAEDGEVAARTELLRGAFLAPEDIEDSA